MRGIVRRTKFYFEKHVNTLSSLLLAAPPGLSAIFFFLFTLFATYLIEQKESAADQLVQRTIAQNRVNDVAGLLSSEMNVRLNLTSSLRAFVITRDEFTPQQFDRFASLIKNDLDGVSSLQLAPNGIVTYLTDLENNHQALGHDLLADPNRRSLAQRSIMERNYIISGPVDLLQGGQAIIARRPIYIFDQSSKVDKFWGFATVLIDINVLLDEVVVDKLRQDYDVSIRGKDGLGAQGDVFFGNGAVFNSPLAAATIYLPNASWQLAVAAKLNQQPQGLIYSVWYWLVAASIAIVGAAMVYSIIDRPRQLKHKISQATLKLQLEITQRMQAEKKIRHMALHDVLTELPNRRLFDELGFQALTQAKRKNVTLAVLFVDIDGFKAVNDSLGHAFGDLLLKMIALRLRQQVRDQDIVARFGGDEFVVLLTDDCHLAGAEKVAAKINAAMSAPFEAENEQVQVSASIGIAIYPEHGITMEKLVVKADIAMYTAKSSGKNCFR